LGSTDAAAGFVDRVMTYGRLNVAKALQRLADKAQAPPIIIAAEPPGPALGPGWCDWSLASQWTRRASSGHGRFHLPKRAFRMGAGSPPLPFHPSCSPGSNPSFGHTGWNSRGLDRFDPGRQISTACRAEGGCFTWTFDVPVPNRRLQGRHRPRRQSRFTNGNNPERLTGGG